MELKDLAEYAITSMPDGITLGEFKFLQNTKQVLAIRNDSITGLNNRITSGFGIRILHNGSWGFAASDELTKEKVNQTIESAYRIASSITRSPNVKLTDEPIYEETISNPVKKDPFTLENSIKFDLLLNSSKLVREKPQIKYFNGRYTASRDRLVLYSTEGMKIDQTITWNGIIASMVASGEGDTQTRTYPDDCYFTGGWEKVENSLDGIETKRDEAIKLLSAPSMKSGKSSIILDPAQLGIQLHESCGHPSELDRSMGYEAAYAGTSFLKTKYLKENFNYGNELVNINADATIEGGLGSFYFDHEGVKGKNDPLVKDGKFVSFLSSRETAAAMGLDHSNGTMRSELYDRMPLIRMTNIMLQPGDWDLDELIADTKDGYYFKTNRSWSIDDLRYNFQFASEVAYRIENGEITGLVKNPTYTGITDEFWNKCSGVCTAKYSKVLGSPDCGKGEPGQTMYTGHGGPEVRFDDVRVGVMVS